MATSTDLRSAIQEVQNQLPPDQARAEGEMPLEGEADWRVQFGRRVGAMPWWVISAATHAVLFLLIALLATAVAPVKQDEVVISTDVVKQKPPEYDPNKKRDIFKNVKDIQSEAQVETPVVVHEKMDESETVETDNNMDKQNARGNEDAISDIPLGGTGTVGSIGVGGGGMAGVFGYRDGGGRKKAVGRFGGSQATESAVEAALRWLARHQEKDGSWAGKKWEAESNQCDVGLTGLALLAFLGAGYTEKSGIFADNVRRAQEWLLTQQRADGAFGSKFSEPWHGSFGGYLHPIAGLAMAESYGMGQNPKYSEAAQKAVDYAIKTHQAPYSGWRYTPKQAGDTSVTGWYVMMLKSAKIAGLKVEGSAYQGAMTFIDSCTNPKDGGVGYTGKGSMPCTTGIGMVCRQFMGTPNTDPTLLKGAEILRKNQPAWDAKNGPGNGGPATFYHWYYGTLAMFQMGGENWTKWNEALKPVLITNQCKGGPLDGTAADKDGSWDPLSKTDSVGGRVYTTALGALTMEIYYRYLPMYTK